METEIGTEGQAGTQTGKHSTFVMPRACSGPRPQDVTRPHEHWCAVCGIGLGGDA